MSPQATPPTPTHPGPTGATPSERFRAWYRGPLPPRRPNVGRMLLPLVLLLDAGAAALAVRLSGALRPAVPVAPLAVPHAEAAEAWDALGRVIVQEGGRAKPFDTFCRESVRTVTGRERFEGNDPIAVIFAWLMRADTAEARCPECDWEQHPFIRCDHPELRIALYAEHRGATGRLSAADVHGHHVEPVVVRRSTVLKTLARRAAVKAEQGTSAALSPLEREALEVRRRLALYDRIRATGAFGIVALDRHSPDWFSLAQVRELASRPRGWQELLEARRQAGLDANEQPYPADAVGDVTAALAALREAYLSDDADTFTATAKVFASVVTRVRLSFDYTHTPATAASELWFNRVKPFRKAWRLGLMAAGVLAMSALVAGRWRAAGVLLLAVGLAGHLAALAWAAIGSYYRATLSACPLAVAPDLSGAALLTAVCGLVLAIVYGNRLVVLAGALVSTLGFGLAEGLPRADGLTGDGGSMAHVLLTVSACAMLALAWGVGNVNLGQMLLAPGWGHRAEALSDACAGAMRLGVVLLIAATLVGGVTPDGMVLAALVCYAGLLIARHAGLAGDFGLALGATFCFAPVAAAWFGIPLVPGPDVGDGALAIYEGILLSVCLATHAALRGFAAPSARGATGWRQEFSEYPC